MDSKISPILQTFKDNWHNLDWRKQRHFAYRASLISSDHFWQKTLEETVQKTGDDLVQKNSFTVREQQEYGRRQMNKLLSVKHKIPRKWSLWRAYPETIYWEDYFASLRYWRWANHSIENFVPTREECLRIGALVQQPKVVRDNPVGTAERLFDLRYFGGIHTSETLRALFMLEYHKAKIGSESRNKVYFLTHVIIGESDYYRKRVSRNHWAVDALVDWFITEGKIGIFSADIWAEVGVCLLLASRIHQECQDMVHAQLLDNYDIALGRLKRESRDTLNRAEHRNIMAVLYWSFYKKSQIEPDYTITIYKN